MSATTVLELAVLGVGLVILALALLGRRPSRWDRAIAEHLRVTGRYPTAEEWRAGRIGEAARPKPAWPRPAQGPVTVTVTAVDGKPVAGAR